MLLFTAKKKTPATAAPEKPFCRKPPARPLKKSILSERNTPPPPDGDGDGGGGLVVVVVVVVVMVGAGVR